MCIVREVLLRVLLSLVGRILKELNGGTARLFLLKQLYYQNVYPSYQI